MTAGQSLRLYDQQAVALSIIDGAVERVTATIERMERALAGAVARMEEMAAGAKKTDKATSNIKLPLEAMAKSFQSASLNDMSKLDEMLKPKNMLLSLAIGVGWELLGDDIMTLLAPAMTVLEAFAGVVHSVVSALGPALDVAAAGAGWLAEKMGLLGENAGMVAPLILGLAAALAVKAAANLYGAAADKIAEIALKKLNMTFLSSPLFWVALAIGVVVAAIFYFVQSVGGLQVAWLMCCNAILTAWDWVKIGLATGVHFVATLFGAMQLLFLTLGFSIQNIVGDMKVGVLLLLQGLVNGAIEIINGFISALNQIPGVSIDLMEQVTFGTAAQLEHEAAKQARGRELGQKITDVAAQVAERLAALDAMKADARAATAEREAGIAAARAEAAEAKAQKAAEPENPDAVRDTQTGLGSLDSVDRVNSVGGVESDVSIADEDLQLMKDVAEMRYVQNFVTLTPTVSMNASISERVDKDTVVASIAQVLEDEVAAYAEGVYG